MTFCIGPCDIGIDFSTARQGIMADKLTPTTLPEYLMWYEALPLQRHFRVLTKFSHVESGLCGRKRLGKAAFDVPINPCVRSACSRSVAVGLMGLKLFLGMTSHSEGPSLSLKVLASLSTG